MGSCGSQLVAGQTEDSASHVPREMPATFLADRGKDDSYSGDAGGGIFTGGRGEKPPGLAARGVLG